MMSLKNYLRETVLVGVKMIEAYCLPYMRRILHADEGVKKLWDDDVIKMNNYILSYGGKPERELTYNFGITSECDYGRLYADRSFSQLWSAVKNTVSVDDYIDIDMVNSQANILYQMATKDLGVENLIQLERYINHRDEWIEEVMEHYTVSKRAAKLLFTSLMNGGSLYSWKHNPEINIVTSWDIPELEQFSKELGRIGDAFAGKRDDLYHKVVNDAGFKIGIDYNVKAKALSRVCKNIEALCLEHLYKRLGCPRYGSLEHDGIRVRRDLFNENFKLDDVLKLVRIDVQNDRDLGFDIEYIEKKPTDFLPMADKEETDGNFEMFDEQFFSRLNTYEEKKKYFEAFHFKVVTPKPAYYHLCYTEQDYGKLELHQWTKADITEFGRNKKVFRMVETKKKNTKGEMITKLQPKRLDFVDEWLEDENIRTYNRIDFIPSNKISSKLTYWDGINERSYNSFLGYSMKCNTPIPENGANMLRVWTDLVFELCGANEEFYNLYINSLAHKIQFPDQKSKSGCFVFKSYQGAGKNMSLVPFEVLLGEYYISSSEENDFWGTYADGYYRKIIINLNEMQMSKEGKDAEGKIKAFITEEWKTMNRKHQLVIKVKNTALPIFYTNGRKPFSIDFRTGERRLNVAEATDKYQNKSKEKFWAPMNDLFRSDKFISTFYNFLSTRDLTGVKWSQVKTKAYMDMAFQYTTSDVLFICDWVEKKVNYYTAMNIAQKNSKLNLLGTDSPMPTRFEERDVYFSYIEFCKEYNIKDDLMLPRHKLFSYIEDLNIGIKCIKSSTKKLEMNLLEVKKKLIEKKMLMPDEEGDTTIEEDTTSIDEESLFDKYGLNSEDFN
jgi:hypothetical protein